MTIQVTANFLKDLLEDTCVTVTQTLLKMPGLDNVQTNPVTAAVSNKQGTVTQISTASCDAVKTMSKIRQFLESREFKMERGNKRTQLLAQRSSLANTSFMCTVSLHGLAEDGTDIEIIVVASAAKLD